MLVVTRHKALFNLISICNIHGKHCGGTLALASKPMNMVSFYNKFDITCDEESGCSAYTMSNAIWCNSSYLPNGKSHVNERIMHSYMTSGLLPSQLDTFINGCGISVTATPMRLNVLQRNDYLKCIEQVGT